MFGKKNQSTVVVSPNDQVLFQISSLRGKVTLYPNRLVAYGDIIPVKNIASVNDVKLGLKVETLGGKEYFVGAPGKQRKELANKLTELL